MKHSLIKFLTKCILLAMPAVILVLYTALFPFAYMDEEYPAWAYSKAMSKESLGSDITLVLGDSRAMADLIPEKMAEPALNLAVGGATTIEMYYTLSEYLKHNAAPERIVIMFAPFHYSYMDNFWQRDAYFNYLSVADMTDLLSNASKTGSETILCDGVISELLGYRLRLPNKYLPALINSHFFGRYSINFDKFTYYQSSKGYGLYGDLDYCDDLNYEVTYEKMHTTADAELIQLYMEKLLSLCVSLNSEVIVLQTPMNEASYNSLQESYVKDYTEYFSNLADSYKGIHFETEIPCYDNSFFGDSSHLNTAGALKYTDWYNHSFQ